MTQMTQTSSNQRIFGDPYHAPTDIHTHLAVPISCKIGIYEDPDRRRLYFPAAGYTKAINYYQHSKTEIDKLLKLHSGINRQEPINKMFGGVPMGSDTHGHCRLEPEPTNTYDPHAIQVIGVQGEKLFILGYVPARINQKILENWDRIDGMGTVNILKDTKGHLVPMVSLGYTILERDNRFARLQI